MATTTLIKSKTKDLATYTSLKSHVRETIARGRERALRAVEQEKVRTSWEVGKLIQKHILLNKKRAAYGAQVIKRLSSDLSISNTELKYMVEFARAYPIGRPAGQLSWSHYTKLLAVNDAKKRDKLISQAVKQQWSRSELTREIKRLKAAKQITTTEIPAAELLIPRRGALNTFKIVKAEIGPFKGKSVVDLGFSCYHRPSGKLPYIEGDIVEVQKNGDVKRIKEASKPGYTYKAYVDRITDADTLWVLIDLGFGFTTKQKLRLRGIDAPEMISRAGQDAKKFVERKLKGAPYVIITSSKSDKYDRYLADLFTSDGLYLNQELIDQGFAKRY